MKRVIILITVSLFILGCAIPSFLAPTQQTADCSSIAITDADTQATLKYGASLLSQGDWKRSYTVNTDQVFVSYISDSLNAVVFVDTIALCNAKTELKNYANEKNIEIMLSNYESYKSTNSCEKDDTLFFQFTAVDQGTNYNVNLWLKPLDEPNRALEIMLVFPQTDVKNMAEYSSTFYPDFTSCK
jgi:hypothetical protein